MTELTTEQKRTILFDKLEQLSTDGLARSTTRIHDIHIRSDLVELLNNKEELERFKGLTIHSAEYGILRHSSCGSRRCRMRVINNYRGRTDLRVLG